MNNSNEENRLYKIVHYSNPLFLKSLYSYLLHLLKLHLNHPQNQDICFITKILLEMGLIFWIVDNISHVNIIIPNDFTLGSMGGPFTCSKCFSV